MKLPRLIFNRVTEDPAARSHQRVIAQTQSVELPSAELVQRQRTIGGVTNLFAKAMSNAGGLRRSDEQLIAKAVDLLTEGNPRLTERNPILAMEDVAKQDLAPGMASRAATLADAAEVYMVLNTRQQRHEWSIQAFADEGVTR